MTSTCSLITRWIRRRSRWRRSPPATRISSRRLGEDPRRRHRGCAHDHGGRHRRRPHRQLAEQWAAHARATGSDASIGAAASRRRRSRGSWRRCRPGRCTPTLRCTNVGSIRVLDKVWLPTRSRAGGDGAGTRRRHRGSSSSCYGRSAPRPGGQERIPWSGPRICRIEYASGYSSSAVGRTQPGHRRQPIWIVTLVVPVRPSRPAVNVMECAPGVSPNTSMMAPSPSGPSTEDAQWSSSSSGSRSSR